MKGLIFNYLEEFVCESFGDDTWDRLFEKCPIHTQEVYIGPETYPDTHLVAILQVSSKTLKLPPEDILKAFGEFAFKKLAEDYSEFLKPYTHPKPFLISIDSVIHVEVMKMLEKSTPPKFFYEDLGTNKLLITYQSPRKLCNLMEGILEGVSKHFSIPIIYFQKSCVLKGDKTCCFDLTFGT